MTYILCTNPAVLLSIRKSFKSTLEMVKNVQNDIGPLLGTPFLT
jgi:hypothetical protein